MGLCPACSRRIENSKCGRPQIFLEHVVAVAQYVREAFPSLRVIMWDDMLRAVDTSVLLGWYMFIMQTMSHVEDSINSFHAEILRRMTLFCFQGNINSVCVVLQTVGLKY